MEPLHQPLPLEPEGCPGTIGIDDSGLDESVSSLDDLALFSEYLTFRTKFHAWLTAEEEKEKARRARVESVEVLAI